jgi:hypothetical protein
MDTAMRMGIAIRRARQEDLPALVRLSELDAKAYPLGPVLVAEVDGAIAAALPLDGGGAIADPFRATRELIALLELRAAQIEPERTGDSLWRRLARRTAPARALQR